MEVLEAFTTVSVGDVSSHVSSVVECVVVHALIIAHPKAHSRARAKKEDDVSCC